MNTATFSGKTLKNCLGRKTVARWRENQGLDQLQVRLVQQVLPTNKLDEMRFPSDALDHWQDDLVITEGDLTATTYRKIHCRSIIPNISFRWKRRECVWDYDPQVSNGKEFVAPTFGFTPQTPPADGTTRDAYRVHLDGKPENALEWAAVINDVGGVALRLVTVRSSEKNSFLRKVVCDLHVPWNKARASFKGFTVSTSRGPLTLTPDTLHEIEVIELAGICLDCPVPSLEAYTRDDGPSGPADQPVTGRDYLDRYHNQRLTNRDNGETIEVTTIEFKPPHYRSLLLD